MGPRASTQVGNRYHERIWVKCDVEKKYVTMSEYSLELDVSVGGAEVGATPRVKREYKWHEIKAKFTPIESGHYKEFVVDTSDSKTVYVTIIAEDGEIIANALPRYKDDDLVVLEDRELREASESYPLTVPRSERP